MARMIDADALAEELLYDAELCAKALDSREITDHKELTRLQFEKDCKQNCVYYISESPTVDAVPVCRCEKCVYWDAGTRQHHKDGESEWDEAICDYFHEIGISQTVYTNAKWFCADGERKGGDE